MSNLPNLFAQKFIAQSQVKAIQKKLSDGKVIYTPHTGSEKERIPWRREDLESHLAGTQTFGHYLLNQANECKLFVLDLDLKKTGDLQHDVPDSEPVMQHCDDVWSAWSNRAHPARNYIKTELKLAAHELVKFIYDELEIPATVAYSGHKGLHVYGLTGLMPADEVRLAAKLVLEAAGGWTAVKGDIFFESKELPLISLEVFPKQDRLSDSDGLGNLVRLPLGKNLKAPNDPTFFLDMTVALSEFKPIDPFWALGDGAKNVWRRQGE